MFAALFFHAAQRRAGISVMNPSDQSELYLFAYILVSKMKIYFFTSKWSLI
jgi:hypothetical protein